MIKLGDHVYQMVRFEAEKKGIKELLSESHNPKLDTIQEKIESLSVLNFCDVIPFSLDGHAKKAFDYALDKCFETFTDVHEQFIFGKPNAEIYVAVSPDYLKVETMQQEFYTPKNVSGASFEVQSLILTDSLDYLLVTGEQKLQEEYSQLKDKNITFLRTNKENERVFSQIMAMDKTLKVEALVEPFKDKDRVEEEAIYQTMNITSQYITIPFILSQFLKEDFSTKELINGKTYPLLQQMASSALGTVLLTNYYNKLGLTHKFKPTDFASKDNSYVLKAEQLYFDSNSSLEKCFELVKQEIDSTLETLKRD